MCLSDFEHYLGHQVLPPIERLCEPIEGTDRARLAECLGGSCILLSPHIPLSRHSGLDPARYRTSSATSSDEPTFSSLDSQMSDSERFKDTDAFIVRCRSCRGELPFVSLHDRDVRHPVAFSLCVCPISFQRSILLPDGPTCPACRGKISTGSLQMQLETQIRQHITKYYEGWTVCEDPTCGHRTRKMGVWGRRCLRQGCRAKVVFEVRSLPPPASSRLNKSSQYSDAQLYNQLRFYASLFNAEKAAKATVGSAHTGADLPDRSRRKLISCRCCQRGHFKQPWAPAGHVRMCGTIS